MKNPRPRFVLFTLLLLAAVGCEELFPHRSEGERLYREHCAECHGLNGAGDTPGYMGNAYADLTDDHWKHGGDPAAMQGVVQSGIFGQMPKFDQLSAKEVRAVVDHVRVLRGETLPGASR
jgi:cytochrome c oxidase cbb3-type subunit 3